MQFHRPANTFRQLTEVEKLQVYVHHMRDVLESYNKAEDKDRYDYTPLLESILAANESVHNMDYANDFFKIGGFELLPSLLNFPEGEVRAASAELVADLLQNNSFCQGKFLEADLTGQLLKLLKDDDDKVVRIKALYALSCLCRSNYDAVQCLLKLEGLPVLLDAVQSPTERLRTKAAFLMSHLIAIEPLIMDTLYDFGFVQILVGLVKEGRSFSLEHLLALLQAFAERHEPSRVLISEETSLEEVLREYLSFYQEKDEYRESQDYIMKVLELCFL